MIFEYKKMKKKKKQITYQFLPIFFIFFFLCHVIESNQLKRLLIYTLCERIFILLMSELEQYLITYIDIRIILCF